MAGEKRGSTPYFQAALANVAPWPSSGGAGEVRVDARGPFGHKGRLVDVPVHDTVVGRGDCAAAHVLRRLLKRGELGLGLSVGLSLRGLAELLGLGEGLGGGIALRLGLDLGALELGLLGFELGLELAQLGEGTDVGILDLIEILHTGDELIHALGVQYEAHESIGALVVLVELAHSAAGALLRGGELGLELGDARLVLGDLLLQGVEVLRRLIECGGGLLYFFLGLGERGCGFGGDCSCRDGEEHAREQRRRHAGARDDAAGAAGAPRGVHAWSCVHVHPRLLLTLGQQAS